MRKKDINFAIIYIILFCVLFLMVLPPGQDLKFHLYRIGAMAEELQIHPFQIPIRILSTSFDGYGYAVPLFYGDTLLYFPALLVLFGVNVVTAYKLFIVVVFVCCFLSMYLSMRLINPRQDFCLLASVFYVFSGYFLLDIGKRAAIGEACAMIFIPIVFASFYSIMYKAKKYDGIFFIFGMSGIISSHILSTVFVSVIILFWIILEYRVILNKKSIIYKLVISGVIILLINASFIIPFIEAELYQKYQIENISVQMKEGFVKHSLDFLDIFLPYEIKSKIASIVKSDYDYTWHPGGMGIFAFISMIIAFRNKNEKKPKILDIFYYGSLVIYALLFIKPMQEILVNGLSFMQFPWRIIMLCTPIWAVYSSYLLIHYETPKTQRFFLYMCLLIGFYIIALRYANQIYLQYKGMEYIKSTKGDFANEYVINYSPNNADELYLPYGVDEDFYKERGEVIKTNHEDIEVEFYRNFGDLYIEIPQNEYNDLQLELPLFHYKGYVAVNQITEEKLDIVNENSPLVQVRVNNATKIKVYYAETSLQTVSKILSLFGIVILLIYVIKLRRNTNEHGSNED